MTGPGLGDLTPEVLRKAFASFPSGITAIAAVRDGRPRGLAASSFTPVSLDPPLVSVCIARTSTTWPALRTAPRLGLSVLAREHGRVARSLAARRADRFAEVSWERTPQGAVFVEGSALWLDCSRHAEVPAGDHEIVLLRIRQLWTYPEVSPLVFHGSKFRALRAADQGEYCDTLSEIHHFWGDSIMSDGMRLSVGGQLDVYRLGFGAMRITGPGVWGDPPDRDEVIRTLRRAVELGVEFIDTADSYGPFVSEDLIAEALYPYPDNLVITTKGGLVRSGPQQWAPVGRPEYLRQCVEMSLRRLRVDRIDLYQFHRPDRQVPVADSLGALRELQEAGKIRMIGVSNFTPEQLAEARTVIDPVCVQNRYNITDRVQEPVLDICTRDGIVFIPWAPIAGGRMARPGGPLDTLAAAHGATVGQLCIAWLLHRSPVMLPIPGTSKVAHLEQNMAAAGLLIPAEAWLRLEEDAEAHLAQVA